MKKIILSFAFIGLAFTANAQDIHPGVAGQGKNIQEQWSKMSPQEKEKAKQDALNAWNNMTPQQKEQMTNQAKNVWAGLTPEQKKQIADQAKAMMNNMTPEQKAALMKEAQNMPPQKVQQLKSDFQQ